MAEIAGSQDETAAEDPPPIIGYGGRIFETHPERQERIAGIFLGTDIAAALVQIDELMAGSARTGAT